MYRSKRSLISLLGYYAVIIVLMLVIARGFFSFSNFDTVFRSTATTLIAAMGMMMVLLIGEIDVSVGAILAMCCVLSGTLALRGVPLLVCILASMALGAGMGLINGAVVVFLKLDSIVATLGLLSIYKGIKVILTGGAWLTGFPNGFLALGQGRTLGINNSIYVAVLVLLIMVFVTRKTAFGRNFYAVGSNRDAARLTGININLVRILAFVLCGMLVGLAAVIYTSRFGSVQSNTGNGWEMTVISAAVVGGTSTLGGEGDAVSVALGALLISSLTTLLVFIGINSLWEEAVQGIIILLSVCTYSIHLPKRVKAEKGGAR